VSSTCFGQLFCPSSGALACVLSLCYFLYQWCTVKQITDNEIYLIFKYIKSVLWRVTKRLSYIEDAQCLKVDSVSHTSPKGVNEFVHILSMSTIVGEVWYGRSLRSAVEHLWVLWKFVQWNQYFILSEIPNHFCHNTPCCRSKYHKCYYT
jgi:hypothetical protein